MCECRRLSHVRVHLSGSVGGAHGGTGMHQPGPVVQKLVQYPRMSCLTSGQTSEAWGMEPHLHGGLCQVLGHLKAVYVESLQFEGI